MSNNNRRLLDLGNQVSLVDVDRLLNSGDVSFYRNAIMDVNLREGQRPLAPDPPIFDFVFHHALYLESPSRIATK